MHRRRKLHQQHTEEKEVNHTNQANKTTQNSSSNINTTIHQLRMPELLQANPNVPGLLDTPEGGANFRRGSFQKANSTTALVTQRRSSLLQSNGTSMRHMKMDNNRGTSVRSMDASHNNNNNSSSLDSSSHHAPTNHNPRRRRMSSKIIQLLPSQELDAFLPPADSSGSSNDSATKNIPPMFADNNEWYEQATTRGIERYTVLS